MPANTQATEHRLTPGGDPIMTAKFLIPASNTPVLQRGRLLDLLTACVSGPVTIVSAPAGSGKTVLASSWVASGAAPGPVTWISLDDEDDVPGIFWTYLITGLHRSGVDLTGVGLPEDPDDLDHSILVRLAARICERDTPVIVLLDNAEGLTRRRICDDLDFLVRHAAGKLRLVVVTRSEPGLPLPQYRLEGLVREIGFGDLAFTPDEAKELLASRRPELPEHQITALSARTGGWAAGLRLADLSALGGDEYDVAVLTDSDIAVYFRSEVLETLPGPVRQFLLATSITEQLSPALAGHLSGLREAGSTLRTLAQSMVFVEPAPGSEGVYRYHPLVREILEAQLRQQFPVRWRRLQRKAAQWYATQGAVDAAARHYAAAGDWDEGAKVLVRQLAVGRLLSSAPSDPLAAAFSEMPQDITGPEVAVTAAAAAFVAGDLDACDKHLASAQELVSGDAIRGDSELELAIALTALARSAALPGGVASAQAAELALIRVGSDRPVDDAAWALVGYGSGSADLVRGARPAARESLTAAVRGAREAGRPYLVAAARGRLALTEALDGRLTAAVEAAGAGGRPSGLVGVGSGALAGDAALAWVASERGDLPAAMASLRAARGLAGDDVATSAVLALVQSRVLRARGDLSGALAVLDDAGPLPRPLPDWLEDRVTAAAAEVSTAQGRPGDAVERVQRRAGSEGEACLLALGWAKLPLGAPGESGRLARQVLHQPDLPLDLRVDAHLLAAASALALGHADAASAAIGEAGRLAATERLRRPFDEAPRRIRSLLEQRSLHASAAPATRPENPQRSIPSARPSGDLIVQPLTEREREVLGYLDALLPTEEIAAKMFVSVNTVKTHVRAILRKLSAERRNEAVRRARDLGLV